MLQRSSQIGEFYRMSPPEVWDTKEKLPPSYMDIMIYDEESDRHVESLSVATDELVAQAVKSSQGVMHGFQTFVMGFSVGVGCLGTPGGEFPSLVEACEKGFQLPSFSGTNNEAQQLPDILFGLEELASFAPRAYAAHQSPVGEVAEGG